MDANQKKLLKTGFVLLSLWLGLSLLVNLPPYTWALFGPFHWALAVEVGVIFAVLALVQARWGRAPRALLHGLAGIVTLLVFLRLADLTARTVVDRPLNLFLDVSLLPALWDVTVTFLGTLRAVAVVAVTIAALIGLHILLVETFARLGRGFGHAPARQTFAVLGVAALAVFGVQRLAPFEIAAWRPVAGSASYTVYQQADRVADTLIRRAAFRLQLEDDPASGIASGDLLAKLSNTDVLIVYIESYGVSAIDDPRYSEIVLPRIDSFAKQVSQAGWSSVSGRLVAATAGGQSWLNHASFSSGRWIDDQTLYSIFLTERPRTLVHDFGRSGWRTVQVKPAITLPWPEGLQLGYHGTLEASDMGYLGPRFYWGIVPDQFALDFFSRRELERENRPPVFASIALISSHAPWLPVPEVVGWDELGDGSVYERWTADAPLPRDVWRDVEAVRDQYRLSIAHSLDAVSAWIADRVDPSSLVIVLGDHQAAPLITGPDASRAVPVHVFSGDPALLAPFEELGFVAGMRPEPAPEAGDIVLNRMDVFRNFMLEAFSGPQARARAEVVPGR
ncbi:MAG TPA: hypothetical protein VLQ65_09020 [Saliniramus sp.]|nr:hypothetical protein [Saliniramus sp.]